MEKMKKTVKEEVKEGGSQVYELGYHLVSSLPEEHLAEKASNIKSVIEKNGGVFIMEDFPKMRPLAYELSRISGGMKQKFNTAYFGWIKFEMDPAQIKEVKKEMDANSDVLRSIIVKTVKENTLYSPRTVMAKVEIKKEGKVGPTEEKLVKEADNAEIDKSIEELVIE